MGLSKRLKTVAGAVTPGYRVADIGTDHGYVPIWLVKEGICPKALAMDVNTGPLQRARDHIREEGLEDRIETRLSNGLAGLAPGDADSIVIAGMGGDLICRILTAAPSILNAAKELILQPQSEWFKVRLFLDKACWRIEKEWFIKEDGKYYVVIRAFPGTGKDYVRSDEINDFRSEISRSSELNVDSQENAQLTDSDFIIYGRYLLEERNPVLLEYLKNEYEKKKRILLDFEKEGRTEILRYYELKDEMDGIGRICKFFYYKY